MWRTAFKKFQGGWSAWSKPYSFKFFKCCLPQILLRPFLNTLSQMYYQGPRTPLHSPQMQQSTTPIHTNFVKHYHWYLRQKWRGRSSETVLEQSSWLSEVNQQEWVYLKCTRFIKKQLTIATANGNHCQKMLNME